MASNWAALRALVAAFAVILASPAVAQARNLPPLEAYGDLPGIEDMAISPSGERLAAISIVGGTRTLLILDANMVLQNIASVEDVKVRSIDWIGEDAVLLLRSETIRLGMGFTTNHLEAHQGIIVPATKDGEIRHIFSGQPSIGGAIMGRYGLRRIDGRWTGYFGGVALKNYGQSDGFVFDHGRPTLYAVDMKNGKGRANASPAVEGTSRHWLVGADGKVAAIFDMRSSSGEWTISSRGRTIAKGRDPEGDAGLVSIGANGDTAIYAAEDPATGLMEWYEVPLDGSNPPVGILTDKSITGIYQDRATGHFIGYLQGTQVRTPVFLDPAKQDAVDKAFKAFGDRDITLAGWSENFDRLLLNTSGTGDSGTWYLVDIATLQAKPLGNERAKIPAEAVGPVSLIEYTAQDGLAMNGVLTLPPGREAKNLPVVMMPHGGPNTHDVVTFDYWAQAFASRGYAVFQPNFRGSTNRTQEFEQAARGEWGRKMQTDISDGLAELARRGIVDPQRACIAGASYGGYAALAGVTLQQGLYRCAVAVAPVADLQLMVRTDMRESNENKMLRRSLEEQLGKRSTLDEVSPTRFAGQADAPILLLHGSLDTVVPIDQSRRMASALKDAEKPHELVVLAEEDHWLSRAPTRKQMVEASVTFVQKHNPAD